MTDTRKKLGWPFWTTITLLVVFVAYPLSMGPMRWIYSKASFPGWFAHVHNVFYGPLDWVYINSPLFEKWMNWYLSFWVVFPGPP